MEERKMDREYVDQVTIKLRVDSGCFCPSHAPEANKIFREFHDRDIQIVTHENGPEIIAWLSLAASGVSAITSVASLIVSIIQARRKGEKNYNKISMILRDTHKTDTSIEEVVLEIYDKDLVNTEIVKTAIEKGLIKRKKK